MKDKLKSKTVLITGATGMIGQNLVAILRRLNEEEGANIRILAHARSPQKAEVIFRKELSDGAVTPLYGDITDLDVKEHVDYIIHTVSVTGGSQQHVDFPMRTISVALKGTECMLELARRCGSDGFVFLSSLEVYGNPGFDKESISETDGGYIDPMNPRSSYSESKRMCECMIAAYARQYGVPGKVARLTATFGRGIAYQDKRVFAQFAKSILNKEDIVLKSTGETVRNYCDAEDAAWALLKIVVDGEPGQAYNIANMNTEISIKDLAERFIALYPESGTKLVFDPADDIAKLGYNGTMRNVLNSRKLMDLGWTPKYGLDEMIGHLMEAFRAQAANER